MPYVLWEASGGVRGAEFSTRPQALDALRLRLTEQPSAAERHWMLWYEDAAGDFHTIATGASLIAMARDQRP